MIPEAIKLAVEGNEIPTELCESAVKQIMDGEATEAQTASLLTALRMKGETIGEITTFAKIMRKFCTSIKPQVSGTLTDTCGTGGDSIKTFNISTIAAFVAAGAGVPIAKHGNRSVTSKCGSADLLEALGVNINLEPVHVQECIEKIGIGFLFAPQFHPAMKHAVPVRKQLGIRTIFNILGPLTNPAGAQAQVIGVYSQELVEKIAYVLKNLGLEQALVVHGSGMDEFSTLGKTLVAELKNNKISSYEINPLALGFKANISELKICTIEDSVKSCKEILSGVQNAKRDIVVLNSAAAVYDSGKHQSIKSALKLAEKSIDSGSALEKLNQLINFYVN